MGACISLFLLSPTAVLAMNYTARDRCGEALALWAVLVNCFCLLLVPRLSLPTAVLPFSWDCRRARVLWTSFLCSCRAHHLSSKSSGTGCSLSMSPWCKREKVALINNFLGLRLLRLPSSPRHCSPLLQTLEEEVLGQRSAAETSWALYLQDLGRAFRLSCCWMQMLRFGISWWGSRCDTLVPLSLNTAEAWTLPLWISSPLLMLWERRKPSPTLVSEQLRHGTAAELVRAPSTLTGSRRTFCYWGCAAVCCWVLVACPGPVNPLEWSGPWRCLSKAWQDDDAPPLVSKLQSDEGGECSTKDGHWMLPQTGRFDPWYRAYSPQFSFQAFGTRLWGLLWTFR